jgi:hypothetical protein
MKKFLSGHTSKETAYVVEGYPWGFKLRTTIRYWIESKQGYGQRFCSQTIDPRSGKWCAPKYSTYDFIKVLYLDDIDHVKSDRIGLYADIETITDFKNKYGQYLEPEQVNNLDRMLVNAERSREEMIRLREKRASFLEQ